MNRLIIGVVFMLVTFMKIVFVISVLTGCGSESSPEGANIDPKADEKAVVVNDPDIHSIALDSKSELPDCSDENKSQLAYIIEEDQFYVCKAEWKKITIKGAKGEKGDSGANGTTTTVHVDGGNSSNVWVDSISGFSWHLGGTNTHAQAESSCSNGYRLPTINEAYAAITHGIRLIAIDISASPDFWTSEAVSGVAGSYYYATVSSGNPSGAAGNASATASVFCIKQ